MTDDRHGFDLAPNWLNSQNSSLQRKFPLRPNLRPSSAQPPRFHNQRTPRLSNSSRPSSASSFSSASQYPALSRGNNFHVNSNSVWGQGTDRFRSLSTTTEQRNETRSNPPSASQTFNRLPRKPTPDLNLRRPKSASLKPASLAPLNPVQTSNSALSSPTGQFQSLGTIRSKKKLSTTSAISGEHSYTSLSNSAALGDCEGELGSDNNNEVPLIPFEKAVDPSSDERYFCKLLFPEWEEEMENTQPLSKKEIQQWAKKQPEKAKERLNNMRARGLGDDSFSILFSALELPKAVS